jgi:hypothetical protein
MLLQAIPYAFDGGPVIRSNDLWEGQVTRRKNGRVLLGMAWTRTSQAYGYAFLEGKCDWDSLSFRREFRDYMAFCSSMLHDTYQKNWEAVVGAKDDLGRVNKALDWVAQYPHYEEIQEFATAYIFILIMRSYRGHVFTLLKDKVQEEF